MSSGHDVSFTVKPIGVIHSPFKSPGETPIQPSFAPGVKGTVELFGEYGEGLKDLEGFSHIELIYFFHRAGEVGTTALLRKPFLDAEAHGIFATRHPARPNPIGLSVVRLVSVTGNSLEVEGIDVLDGTPLLDIKPYVARFDVRLDTRSGWMDQVGDQTARRRGERGPDEG